MEQFKENVLILLCERIVCYFFLNIPFQFRVKRVPRKLIMFTKKKLMKKILAFGASNSQNSINKQLANYAASQLAESTTTLIDLNDFAMPLYGIDLENAEGVPEAAHRFKELIRSADGIVISFAEHNGSYSVAFKNIFDWTSRIEKTIWSDKPMLLLATSPGGRGGQSVLTQATTSFPFMSGKVLGSFALPSFQKNFSPTDGILDADLQTQFKAQLALFEEGL